LDWLIFRIDASLVGLFFAGFMLAFWALGRLLGRSLPADAEHDPESKLADATMALLGLLLAFTFAMSLERHNLRILRVVDESNAIRDLYNCATLLAEPQRSALQVVVREYAQNELDAVRQYLPDAEQQQAIERSQKLHARMTDIVSQAVAGGTPIAVSLTDTLNGVTSAHGSRLAAYEELVPWTTQMLLLAGAVVAFFLLGRQQGASRRVRPTATYSFIALVSLAIFVILELNQPRRGLITVNYDCFNRLVRSIAP
jgi:hypothetical protein